MSASSSATLILWFDLVGIYETNKIEKRLPKPMKNKEEILLVKMSYEQKLETIC